MADRQDDRDGKDDKDDLESDAHAAERLTWVSTHRRKGPVGPVT